MDISAFPAQLARTQRFTLGVPRAFTISSDGRQILFLRSQGGEGSAKSDSGEAQGRHTREPSQGVGGQVNTTQPVRQPVRV